MGPISEQHLMLFLIQFALVLGLCKFVGYFFAKLKQSSVTSDILVGVMLGPAILGRLFPGVQAYLFPAEEIQRSMLETIAWFGNLFLLMEAGLEINFSRVWQQRSDAVKLSMSDLTLPIIISFIPLYFLPSHYLIDPSHRVLFALFIAAVMTISALPVAIRGMRDLNILKTDVGFLILSALTMNDIAGWVLFTIILGIFSHGSLELSFVLRLVFLTLAFTLISLTIVRKIVDKMVTFIHNKAGDGSGLKITFIMLIGAIFGAITLKIGIHSLFGFFIAGTILG
ncbi:MAG: cation:proton antiporter, partial [Candidatus Cloacimonetes bacterium]|nr:cation:proton antiporter [Candidatus Cloacimonadota bacterium]MCK9243521.1 cation:proton antiporter [Candidatus Cloacimonadota bacterium]